MWVFLGSGSDGLSNHPSNNDVGVLGIRQHTFSCVKASEIGRPVNDNALNRHVESLVETLKAIAFEDLSEAVSKATEFSLSSGFSNVGSKPCSGEVKGVHEAKGCCTSCATRCQISSKITPELCFWIHSTQEDLLVLVFEGEVEGLGREVTDHISQITSPKGNKALFLWDSYNTVYDSLVLVRCGDLLADMLHLQQQLDSLNGSNGCL